MKEATKKEKNLIIFLGPPGSGKGSLSALCVKRLGWHQLSTGNLCRDHIARQTELGKHIDFAIKSGKLISDDVIIQMAKDWLIETFKESHTVIFDGFPRTLTQAIALQELVKSLDDVMLSVIRMEIEQEAVEYRLLARAICQNNKCQSVYSLHKHSSQLPRRPMICNECENPLMRRSDDEQIAIKERLKIYQGHEKELRDFYEQIEQPIRDLPADLPLEAVYTKLLELVDTPRV